MTPTSPLVRVDQRTFPPIERSALEWDRLAMRSRHPRLRARAHARAVAAYQTSEEEQGMRDWDGRRSPRPAPRRNPHPYDPLGIWLYAILCVVALLAAYLLRGLG